MVSHHRDLTLTELANRFGSDKGDLVGDRHGYTSLYELLFGPSRHEPIALLEIGLARGGPETVDGRIDRHVDSPSVAMWLNYFPRAHIYGFDISDFSHLSQERFTFVRGDAGSKSDLDALAGAAPAFDIIIDDGSHASFHQQYCLKHLWSRLRQGGLYIIEDLHWQSPVFETSLPGTPRTADLFGDLFQHGSYVNSAVFTAEELSTLLAEVESHAIFRDHAARSDVPKLLVLRKRQCEPTSTNTRGITLGIDDGAAKRPRVKSFDLFDTLCARRCIRPHAIHELVEQRLNLAAFAQSRIAAETHIAGEDYGLDDIYKQLLIARPDLADTLEAAKALEIGLELEHLFPIAENTQQVGPNDIIVSDMYLPREIVEQIVHDKVGLPDTRLFLTPHGKGRGTIWPMLQQQFDIVEHLGDNSLTDMRSPAAFGITGRQTSSFEPSSFERELIARGLPRLGEAARECRLTSWSSHPEDRQLQLLQTNVNAPTLLVASILVLRAAHQAGASRILASSRDCYLWLNLLQQLQAEFAPGVASEYFFTSRLCRSFPTASYLDYVCRQVGTGRTFILDICGTGWSLQRLFDRLGLDNAHPILLQKILDPSMRARYESWAPTSQKNQTFSLLDPGIPFNNGLVELANSALHNSVADVTVVNGTDTAFCLDWPVSPRMIRFRAIQEQAFLTAIPRLLTRSVLDELSAAPSDKLGDLLSGLYGGYSAFAPTLNRLMPEHRLEDERMCELLSGLGQIGTPRVTSEFAPAAMGRVG